MNLTAVLFSTSMLLAVPFAIAAEPQSTPSVTEVNDELRLYRTQHFDLKSGINGRVYRITIADAKSPAPTAPAPTLYVLDGGQYFETAAIAALSCAA